MPVRGIPITIFPAVRKLIAEGVSQRRAMQMLRTAGFRFGNERFRIIWNTLNLERDVFRAVRSLDPRLIPDRGMIVPVEETAWTMGNNFTYRFGVSIYDQEGRFIRREVRSISSPTLVPPEQLARRLNEIYSRPENVEKYGQKIQIEEVRGIFARADIYRQLEAI